MRRAWLRCAAAACAAPLMLVMPRAAEANGRFPAASQIVASPADPNILILRTTFGTLFTRDHGANWDWICEKSVGYGGVEDPSFGITQANVAIAGTFEGLSVSPDMGCSWSFAGGGLSKQVIVDVAVRRDNPHSAVAITSSFAYATDAGDSRFSSQIYQTMDDGTTWTPYGVPIDPTVLVETVDVTPDPHRVFVSGIRGSGPTLTAALFVSTDDAAHWTEHPIPIIPSGEAGSGESGVYIAAVDPSLPDRVYVRTNGMDSSRLFVTNDDGANFNLIYTAMGPLLGFALSPDGSTIFTGGMKDGLMVAAATDFTFTQRSPIAIQCLAFDQSTLFACSNEASSMFIVGSSDDNGTTFAPKLLLSTVRGPLACGAGTSAAQCVDLWPMVAASIGAGQNDAGAGEGGTDGGGGGGGGGKSGGGCSLPAGAAAGSGVVGVFLAAAVALLRRRRR